MNCSGLRDNGAINVKRGFLICCWHRSLKKQYIRLLKAVQSYAVISVGVKISLITIDKVRTRDVTYMSLMSIHLSTFDAGWTQYGD